MQDLPIDSTALIDWTWPEIEPHYAALASRSISRENVESWLLDWTRLSEKINEMYARLSVATSVDTADKEAEAGMHRFLDTIYPGSMAFEQRLKEKLLAGN